MPFRLLGARIPVRPILGKTPRLGVFFGGSENFLGRTLFSFRIRKGLVWPAGCIGPAVFPEKREGKEALWRPGGGSGRQIMPHDAAELQVVEQGGRKETQTEAHKNSLFAPGQRNAQYVGQRNAYAQVAEAGNPGHRTHV